MTTTALAPSRADELDLGVGEVSDIPHSDFELVLSLNELGKPGDEEGQSEKPGHDPERDGHGFPYFSCVGYYS